MTVNDLELLVEGSVGVDDIFMKGRHPFSVLGVTQHPSHFDMVAGL